MLKLLFVFFISLSLKTIAQEKIKFPSLDGLSITADYYKGLKTRPVIVMFHQVGFSRGEYIQAAKVLQKLGYTCVAIDQRSGKEVNGVSNETADLAKQKKLATDYLDAEKDLDAAIEYCFNRFQKKVMIMGSSYTASLALKLSTTNEHVLRVMAFSPGEYFGDKLHVSDFMPNIKVLTWVTSSKEEANEVTTLLKNGNKKYITQFVPTQAGEHGAKVLWQGDDKTNEYWKSLLNFLKMPSF